MDSMAKKIVLIAGTESTRVNLLEQLKSYIGDLVDIESYATDLGIDKTVEGDLVIISTELIYDDALRVIRKDCPIIVAKRILNYSKIEKLFFIPQNEEVLFVNDAIETTFECIDWLKHFGIDHINYVPYYPGCPELENIKRFKTAITPGEVHIVPETVENVIDMGPRLIDIITMGEILKQLDLFEERWQSIYEEYMKKIIALAKGLAEISREKSEAYQHIKMVMDGVKEGILAFNEEGKITVFNENLKYLLGIRKTAIIGKNIREIIYDASIRDFLMNMEGEDFRVINSRGLEILLTKFKIKKEGTTIATFKDLRDTEDIEKRARRELYSKGYYGKYVFEDIIGTSRQIIHTKDIAKKLAVSDLTLLIEGESGTGKELFASAVHNFSPRRDKPFVAVNFSSIAENLVESELFGYEEGAFTGAVKGGKPGLFEQADGGTILLDEIGDASLKVQTRLLRVLQEKEIMRVGGTRIIPVDVRIVAATNKNLSELVRNGLFREDLYHRLKVLYIKIPPLRQRKEDIFPLVKYFMEGKCMEHIDIEKSVIERLESYSWYGNVREIKNTIDYMLAVCNGKSITVKDLPEKDFFQDSDSRMGTQDDVEIMGDYRFILECLYKLNRDGKRGSRKVIEEIANASGITLTEQMIRNRLDSLEKYGYITKEKGRRGTALTSYGFERTKKLMGDIG